MARAINVTDDRGTYGIVLGARPIPWATMKREIEESYAYEDGVTFAAVPLLGWAPWRWAICIDNPKADVQNVALCFVDGDEEPDLPYS